LKNGEIMDTIIDFKSLISDNTINLEVILKFAPSVFKKLILAKKYVTIKVENVSNDKTLIMCRKYKNLLPIEITKKFSESSCLLSCFMDYWLKPEFNKFCKNIA